ncbi:unnamed protein product [Orchesella dallaii]|uniref:Uncharacterized protein n=1 Tax=Orchesella dallaii TaxID=48710 RepID=A0ABP1PVP0_9HEXA
MHLLPSDIQNKMEHQIAPRSPSPFSSRDFEVPIVFPNIRRRHYPKHYPDSPPADYQPLYIPADTRSEREKDIEPEKFIEGRIVQQRQPNELEKEIANQLELNPIKTNHQIENLELNLSQPEFQIRRLKLDYEYLEIKYQDARKELKKFAENEAKYEGQINLLKEQLERANKLACLAVENNNALETYFKNHSANTLTSEVARLDAEKNELPEELSKEKSSFEKEETASCQKNAERKSVAKIKYENRRVQHTIGKFKGVETGRDAKKEEGNATRFVPITVTGLTRKGKIIQNFAKNDLHLRRLLRINSNKLPQVTEFIQETLEDKKKLEIKSSMLERELEIKNMMLESGLEESRRNNWRMWENHRVRRVDLRETIEHVRERNGRNNGPFHTPAKRARRSQ